MSLEVRPANPADLDWLIDHDHHVSPDWLRRCVAAEEILVASLDGDLVGFLRFAWFWRAIPYMELIHVLDAHRRSGVGSALVGLWEARVRAQGAVLLMTSSMSDEPEPQAWHRRNGFVESGALTFGRLEPTPEVFFVKDL
jgi:GNAT superfamily N-acetyltransferase